MNKHSYEPTEEDIISYMEQFKVGREEATEKVIKVMNDHLEKEEDDLEELQESILRGRY